MNYNKMIDHTVLKADTPLETVKRICDEAMEYGFASVCINPCHVAYCADYLKDSDVNVCTVIGFPLGANTSAVKAFETKDAIANGADEIDMVMNIGALKDKNYDLVRDDVKAVVEAANGTLVKVILETCLLTEDEIKKAQGMLIKRLIYAVAVFFETTIVVLVFGIFVSSGASNDIEGTQDWSTCWGQY